MEFNPNNPIVQRCLQGMALEESGNTVEANKLFVQAWNEAGNDFEKFLAAYHIARLQEQTAPKVQWLQTALQLALGIDDHAVRAAYPNLYRKLAECYEQLGEAEKAEQHRELSEASKQNISDPGPFYHGSRADLAIGDMLVAGRESNYKAEFTMNHIYFTALANGAGLAAALAKGEGRERVYIVEPTGSYEHDPNVTDKKFPGNPTRSYRTSQPMKIVGELTEWHKQTPEDIQKWREKLAKNNGAIIN